MKAFIYTGGTVYPDNITEHPRGDDLVIAADSGWRNALKLGEKPAVLIGDFDSFGGPLPDGPEIIALKREKDDTDTQAAAGVAVARGAEAAPPRRTAGTISTAERRRCRAAAPPARDS